MQARPTTQPCQWDFRAFKVVLDLGFFLQALALVTRVQAARNVTQPEGCEAGGWQVANVAGVRVVSTTGPSVEIGNVIPQMFIRFRGSALFLTTSPESRALGNFTISAGDTTISTQINTTVQTIGAINLVESETTQLSITYVTGGRLDIGIINITVSDDSASLSSLLPTATLPLPTPPPSFTVAVIATTSANPEPTQSNNNNTFVAQAVGLTVGLGLGLTSIAVLAFLFYRLRSRRRRTARFATPVTTTTHESPSHPELVGKAY
ncbi:hypothetical protein ONZ45_g4800 [Pleurotus djamor]|nr:hypothetical protein ONZ45_g4800 [Pleurotus djamor]